MLATMWMLWAPDGITFTDHSQMAAFGNRLFQSLIIIQIAVILLVAPVATAGSICVDKSRGTLYHVFVTDLTDREIVLGKLGARLLSLVTLMTCGVPVLAIGGLLGGVQYNAILGAFLVSVGVAVFASSLAMTLSVWVRKPHHALLATYVILGLWVAIYPLSESLDPFTSLSLYGPAMTSLSRSSQRFVLLSNPIGMALAPYLPGGDAISLWQPAIFLFAAILASLGLIRVAIRKLRPVAIRQMDRARKREKTGVPGRILNLLPGPPLDGNPVLWREWHRKKPTKWTGRFWTAYVILSSLASLFVIMTYFASPLGSEQLAAIVNGWEVAIGLLLLTISATTSLAEERDRGSLDVIMTTPLPSRTILWGKWWGTFAMVPRLSILPIWVCVALAIVAGNYLAPLFMIGMILAMAAAVTSIGIAVATWIPRLGRAIAVGVLIYAVGSLGIVFLHHSMSGQPGYGASFNQANYYYRSPVGPVPTPASSYQGITFSPGWNYDPYSSAILPINRDYLLLANPYYAISETTNWAGRLTYPAQDLGPVWREYRFGQSEGRGWALMWIGVFTAISLATMGLVLKTFDRCLGRITRTTPNWDQRDAAIRRPKADLLPSPLP